MEGWVFWKVKRFFSSKYEKIWAELDQQTLYIYDQFDIIKDCPLNIKTTINIKDAELIKRNDAKYQVKDAVQLITAQFEGSKKRKLVFDCSDDISCSQWFSAFKKAISLHNEEQERLALPIKCCTIMQIDPYAPRSETILKRQYKKLSLTHHPDRGGNPNGFAQINQAYNSLLALQVEEDEKSNCSLLYYDVSICKGGDGIGLGITLLEDKIRGQVVIQSVLENIIIHEFYDKLVSSINPGDAIVAINGVPCRTWFLSRLKARLNHLRVPVGTSVTIKFERRVFDDDETQAANNVAKKRASVRRSLKPILNTQEGLPESVRTTKRASFVSDDDVQLILLNGENWCNNDNNSNNNPNLATFSKNIINSTSNENANFQENKYDNSKLLQGQLDMARSENYQLRLLVNKNAEANDKAQIEIKELNEKVNTYKNLLEDKGSSDFNILAQRVVELQAIISSVNIDNNLLDAQLANMRYAMKEKGQQNINLNAATSDKIEFERSKIFYKSDKNYTYTENIALNIEKELQHILTFE